MLVALAAAGSPGAGAGPGASIVEPGTRPKDAPRPTPFRPARAQVLLVKPGFPAWPIRVCCRRTADAGGSLPMIDLYTWPTPTGHKIHIMLEQCVLAYNVIPIDIGAGDQ